MYDINTALTWFYIILGLFGVVTMILVYPSVISKHRLQH